MEVKRLVINSDSQLVVSQVNDSFSAKDKSIATYLKLVIEFIPAFEKFELVHIPRSENARANNLSKLASNKDSKLHTNVPIELVPMSSSSKRKEVMWVEGTPLWMEPIIAFLKHQTLPSDREKIQKLRR